MTRIMASKEGLHLDVFTQEEDELNVNLSQSDFASILKVFGIEVKFASNPTREELPWRWYDE